MHAIAVAAGLGSPEPDQRARPHAERKCAFDRAAAAFVWGRDYENPTTANSTLITDSVNRAASETYS